MINYSINDNNWKIIYTFLLQQKGIHVKNEGRVRLFLEAIFYKMRSGIQWRLIGAYYGDWRALHKRFLYWVKKGMFEKLFLHVQQDPDMEFFMIDSTIVRAHACAAGYGRENYEKNALGRSKGGFTTKIHALVDSLGLPLKFILTSGQRNDITQAKALIEGRKGNFLLADKGYDSNDFIAAIKKTDATPVIPSRNNRVDQRFYDKDIYKERHNIECFFGKIKHFRGICSRFDKSAAVFMGFLHFVGALIWLR